MHKIYLRNHLLFGLWLMLMYGNNKILIIPIRVSKNYFSALLGGSGAQLPTSSGENSSRIEIPFCSRFGKKGYSELHIFQSQCSNEVHTQFPASWNAVAFYMDVSSNYFGSTD